MEIQTLQTGQRTKIDIYRSPKSVPTCKSLFLLALDVPEGIADVLKIKFNAALQQACPLAAPTSKQVTVRSLARFVTVRTGNRFLLRSLRTNRKSEQTNAKKKGKQKPTLSNTQATHLLTAHDD